MQSSTIVGLHELGTTSENSILHHQYRGLKQFTLSVNGASFDIFIDEVNQVIITSVTALDAHYAMTDRPTFADVRAALVAVKRSDGADVELAGFASYRLISPVVGPGINGQHIVTVCRDQVHPFEHGVVINSKSVNSFRVDDGDELAELGTQSVTDGYTCGYHTLSNINLCRQWYSENRNKPMTAAVIDPYLRDKQKLPVEYGIEQHQQAANQPAWQGQSVPDTSLLGHIKQAAVSTFYRDDHVSYFCWNPLNIIYLASRFLKEVAEFGAEYAHAHQDRSSGVRQGFWTAIAGACHVVQGITNIYPWLHDKVASGIYAFGRSIKSIFSSSTSNKNKAQSSDDIGGDFEVLEDKGAPPSPKRRRSSTADAIARAPGLSNVSATVPVQVQSQSPQRPIGAAASPPAPPPTISGTPPKPN